MDTSTLERALRAVGERMGAGQPVEMLLVGGAAAMVTGLLPPGRTTVDCDVMVYDPAEAEPAVERVADQVSGELGLAEGWLNSDVRLRQDTLPDGWKQRRIWVGNFRRLRVFAASRPDLIAMKVLAGRAQDLEDLEQIRVTRDEAEFVRPYLDRLSEKGTHAEQVAEAHDLLKSLTLYEP